MRPSFVWRLCGDCVVFVWLERLIRGHGAALDLLDVLQRAALGDDAGLMHVLTGDRVHLAGLLAARAPAQPGPPAGRADAVSVSVQLRVRCAVHHRALVFYFQPKRRARSRAGIHGEHMHQPGVRHPGHAARLRVLVLCRLVGCRD